MGGGTTLELHGYQKDYLGTMAAAQGYGSEAAALQSIVDKAIATPSLAKTLFESGFHCVHCGSKNPPAWIDTRKGKEKCALTGSLTKEALAFLAGAELVKVGPPGPQKALQTRASDEKKRKDKDKAARICIDWAIKEHGDYQPTVGSRVGRVVSVLWTCLRLAVLVAPDETVILLTSPLYHY